VNEPQKTSVVGCIGWTVVLVLLVGGAAVGGYYLLRGAHQEGGYLAVAGPWGGSMTPNQTFSCGGNDERTLEDVTVTLSAAPGISAGGNCHLTLVNCNVTAPSVIDASGNAQVTIRGGSIHGTTAAITASGNAHVAVEGATVDGPVSKSGSAQVTGVPE
jgi:hypothetical protein